MLPRVLGVRAAASGSGICPHLEFKSRQAICWASIKVPPIMDSDLQQRRAVGERVLRLLVDSIRDYALLALDQEGRVISCNKGAAYTFGYTESELIGRSLATLMTEEDQRAQIHQRELRDAQIQERALDERWHVRKDGSRFWGLGITVPVREADGTLLGFGKIVRDRTDLKQLQAVLESRADELAQNNEDKSVFIATLAHELRSPLSAISQIGKVLERSPSVDRQQVAKMIGRQCEYIQHLITDLMDLTRMGQGKLQLQRARLDMRQIVEGSIEIVQPEAQQQGVELSVTQPTEPVMICADPQRLLQIFVNLLGNAVKFSDRGMRVDVTVDNDGNHAVTHVLDRGAGIPADQLDSIFELFSQARNAGVGSAGLGIGLALTKDLVNLHGGSIQVRSEGPGKGSEFTVRLPLAS